MQYTTCTDNANMTPDTRQCVGDRKFMQSTTCTDNDMTILISLLIIFVKTIIIFVHTMIRSQ